MTDFGEESLALHATMTYGKIGDTQKNFTKLYYVDVSVSTI